MRHRSLVALIGLVAPCVVAAQPLAARIARIDGMAQITFASQPGTCGDGKSYIGNLLGNRGRSFSDGNTFVGHGSWENRPCVPGPVRVVATVTSGEVTRLRMYIGPVPPPDPRITDLGLVPVRDATAWLHELVARGTSRVANDAMESLVAAEGSEPWPQFLAVARDDQRPRDTRRQAMFWLGEATNRHLGIDNADASASDDDDVKEQVVFALSQMPRDIGIPKLLELARSSKNAPVRKQAVFWLGQSGDPRATALFAELMGLR